MSQHENDTYNKYENMSQEEKYNELIGLVRWCARRLPKSHETFAQDELDRITGIKHRRV